MDQQQAWINKNASTGKEKAMTTQSKPTELLLPVAVSAKEGEARWWMGSLAIFKLTAADTNGQMSIIEIVEAPHAEAPRHVHEREDEGFWILEGEATFEVGEQIIHRRAGDYLFGPRGIPHRYTVGAAGCRMLFIFTPGGFEELVRAISEPAATRTLPPPSNEMPDMERLLATIRAYGGDILE
jgi:quercetin dioxygenase-like cupin family protein